MSYNGAGTFQINTTGQPVVTGTIISSSVFNALTADLATGLSTAICKDGQTTITNDIPFSNNKITGLGDGTAAADAVNYGQLTTLGVPGYTTTATAAGTTTLSSSSNWLQFFTGSTTQTVVLPVVTTLVLGFQFQIVNNSTGNVTIESSGANTVATVPGSTNCIVTCIKITGTDETSWDVKFSGFTSETGTGASVRATSPTLVTPALGTPSSIDLTNATANTVANTALAQMPDNTIKGNNTGSTANAADLTAAQTAAILPAVVGDSGSGGTKGLVPAPASGDAAAGKYLDAAGTWTNPFKAWVNFSVSAGTVTINGSFNVTSVTKNSTGIFTVAFTNNLPSANYVGVCTVFGSGGGVLPVGISTHTTSAYKFETVTLASALADPDAVECLFVGG